MHRNTLNIMVQIIVSFFDVFVKSFFGRLFPVGILCFSVLFVTKVIDDFAKDDILYKRQSFQAGFFSLVCVYILE